ncbi:hypothetical protein ERJ75_001156000 [Trypanosoma vivax]|nr:hypothetical protein ERJ75_001156000 [Trypanosoma vivax]
MFAFDAVRGRAVKVRGEREGCMARDARGSDNFGNLAGNSGRGKGARIAADRFERAQPQENAVLSVEARGQWRGAVDADNGCARRGDAVHGQRNRSEGRAGEWAWRGASGVWLREAPS